MRRWSRPGPQGVWAVALLATLLCAALPAVAEAKRSLYVSNRSTHDLSAFTINADGSLSAIGSPTPTDGDSPRGVAITPDGTRLYAANSGGDLSAFTINANGSLSAIGAPTPTGGSQGVAITPDGRRLYVANGSDDDVSAFTILASGSLSPIGTPTATGGSFALGVAITPDGRRLYVANAGSDDVSALTINADGSLSPITGAPTPQRPSPAPRATTRWWARGAATR